MRLPVTQSGSRFFNWIKDASSNGKWPEILHIYRGIKASGAHLVDSLALPLILKACSNLSFRLGTAMHGCLIRQGFESFTSVGNSTIDFYTKWGDLDSAQHVFYSLEERDSISWNVMVHGNFSNGFAEAGLCWFKKGRLAHFQPNVASIVLVIHAYRDLNAYSEGFVLHGYVIRSGYWATVTVQNSLLSLYAEVSMHSAQKLFDEMSERNDIVSWSVMTAGYNQSGKAGSGLQMFRHMLYEIGIAPDGVTLVSVLKACANLGDISLGNMVHGLVISKGLESDIFVGNSLIDMYSKCSDSHSAFRTFKEMPEKNTVSWNLMLSAFALNGRHLEAVSLLDEMEKEGIEKDEATFVSVLQLFKHFLDPLQCKSVHCMIIRRGYESNESVLSSVIDAYAKCSLMEIASKLFEGMKKKDTVAWSTMIAGFAHNGKPDQAIFVFKQMNEVAKPNEISILNLMEACSVSAESRRSKWAHGIAIRRGLANDVAVGTAIIDMYSKCGEIEASERAFSQIPDKNVVCWTAMISAYGINGLASEALALLERMKQNNVKPNSVTALSILSACSHRGLLEEGLSIFASMGKEQGVELGSEHYSCVVDMLARAGKFDCVLELIKNMPEEMDAGASAWGALLSSCRSHGNVELGSEAAVHVLGLEPLNWAGYVLASNVYTKGMLMVDSARVRGLAKERGVRVVAGYSLVHINSETCRFVAGDELHPRADEIYSVIDRLHGVMNIDYSKVSKAVGCN